MGGEGEGVVVVVGGMVGEGGGGRGEEEGEEEGGEEGAGGEGGGLGERVRGFNPAQVTRTALFTYKRFELFASTKLLPAIVYVKITSAFQYQILRVR